MAKYEDLRGEEDWLLATTGRAWVFGDHVSRAAILADAHLDAPVAVAAAQVFAAHDPGFCRRVQSGDFVVAGIKLATDAPQRIVPAALKALGIVAIIARSFGEEFVRNAIGIGLPALQVEETAAIKSGDHLRVDVEAHVVANLSSGDRYVVRNIDDEALAILRAGGVHRA